MDERITLLLAIGCFVIGFIIGLVVNAPTAAQKKELDSPKEKPFWERDDEEPPGYAQQDDIYR